MAMTVLREPRTRIRDFEARVQGEYLEMPGQRLTVAQASKLWDVKEEVAAAVLENLVEQRFLRRVGPYYFRSDLGVSTVST
jgi:Fic family protein